MAVPGDTINSTSRDEVNKLIQILSSKLFLVYNHGFLLPSPLYFCILTVCQGCHSSGDPCDIGLPS